MPHPVDVHVGKRIRQRRWLLEKTQQDLAEIAGVKFQQIQKYETGANRVSASRLWIIAEALDVPISHFFEGLNSNKQKNGSDFSREELSLINGFRSAQAAQRSALLGMAQAMNSVT